MKKLLLFALFATGLLTSLIYVTPRVFAVNSSTIPTAEFLAAALRNQELACGQSLEVRYTCETHKVGDGMPYDDVRKFYYVRTPEALYADVEKQNGKKIVYSYDRGTQEYRMSSGSQSGRIGEGLADPFGCREFLETTRYYLYEGPLCESIKSGTVREQMEKIDGHDCLRVEISTARGTLEKYIVWVDPTIGFNPRRIEFVWKEERPTVVMFEEYAQIDGGFWFPKKQVNEYFDTGLNAAYTQTNIVDTVSTGRTIPKDQLTVKFPSGTTVLRADGMFEVP